MKLFLAATLALLSTAVVATADPKIVAGCEVVLAPHGTFYVKADPSCQMTETGGSGTDGFLVAALSIWAEQNSENDE